jgi:serine/threonine protein kinase
MVETISDAGDPLATALRRPAPVDPYQDESALRRAEELVEAIGRDPSFAVNGPLQSLPVEPAVIGTLGQYQLLEKLGEGGMGAVYKALHTKLEKVVALKVLKVLPANRLQNPNAISRFEREMRAVGKLNHVNIVAAHDAGEIDDKHYLVMELVDGIDLSELMRRVGPLNSADACELIRQAAVGLQHAHGRGMVHRDIKPSNLMLARTEDGEPLVKVLDMGLALLDDQQTAARRELTTTGQMMGTLDYMAPEQGSDSHVVDIRADIYSLGATLFKLLCGKSPFSGEKSSCSASSRCSSKPRARPSLSRSTIQRASPR